MKIREPETLDLFAAAEAEGPPFVDAKPPKRVRPLGFASPYVWSIEPAYGCNLRCGHCCADLVPKDDYELMSESTWRSTFAILAAVSPTVRVDLCGYVGEPTLNPNLERLLPIARRVAPLAQIQITTNGTKLLTGDYSMAGLLDAGANILYVDQYGDKRRYEKLARESGYPFYRYYDAPPDAPTPWRYWGPDQKVIVLMDEPSTWPRSRLRAGLLGNWYGNMNWDRGVAQRDFGMAPLETPLVRRCNQPFLYVTVSASGDYLLCCQDGLQTTRGRFGNVSTGVDGFRRFWFGIDLQTIRRRLRFKNRAATVYACARCNVTFARCDYRHWTDSQTHLYFAGGDFDDPAAWRELPPEPGVDRFVEEAAE